MTSQVGPSSSDGHGLQEGANTITVPEDPAFPESGAWYPSFDSQDLKWPIGETYNPLQMEEEYG